MTTVAIPAGTASANSAHDSDVRTITAIMAVVVALTFLFGFGNVWALAVRLGVTPWVAPLVAPAVDLSILGLLLAIRRLVLLGADPTHILPARRLLVFASTITLALNIAEPLITHHYGRAAFDAVGPLLLIGWSEVGPGLIDSLNRPTAAPEPLNSSALGTPAADNKDVATPQQGAAKPAEAPPPAIGDADPTSALLVQACAADQRHWQEHRRPISAETLRKELKVGAGRARELVRLMRSTPPPLAVPRRESHKFSSATAGAP